MTRTWSEAIGSLGKSLAIGVTVYLGFRLLGEFSARQSGLLAALAWLGFGLYQNLSASQRPAQTFSPFCVSICPNWLVLLKDFGLISSDKEYDLLREEVDRTPTGTYNVFRSGIFFTVIAPPSSDGLLPGLTYSGNHKTFVTRVEISEGILQVDRDNYDGRRSHPFFKHPLYSNLPELFFRWGTGGYEIELEVQSDWWDEVSKSGKSGVLAKPKPDKDYACGTTRLTVAVLPYSEFEWYYRNVDYKEIERLQATLDSELNARGWRRQVETHSEVRDPWSRIDHKYVAVAHREV